MSTPKGMMTALHTDKQTRYIDNNSNTRYHKTKHIDEQSAYVEGEFGQGH